MVFIGNDKIKIGDIQDSRIWLHSEELGFGKWINNSELQRLIGSKSGRAGFLCVKTNEHALTIGKHYEILDEKDGWVYVIDDTNNKNTFPKDCFAFLGADE